jgi:hypothetical protein
MSRTLLQVITKVAQIIDPKHYMSGTTSSSGNAVGSVVDITANGLQRFNNDAIVGKHFYWSSGTPSPNTSTVTNFTQSTGKALIRPDLAAAPNSEAYYLLPYRKQLIEDAIANAVWTLHDTGDLVREILMYGYVAGSPIYNAGFDYWTSSTTPDGWSAAGSATLAKEPAGANTFMSRQSLKVSGAADYVKLDEPWKSWLADFKGGNVRFQCPVMSSNASHARIAVYDGSTINYSSYHSGGGSREILDTGDINISSTATDLEIRLYNDDTNAVYFGDSWIEGTGVTIRELPIAIDYASDIAVVEGLDPGNNYRHSGRGQTIYDYALANHTDHETTTQYGVMQFVGRKKPSDGRRLRITASGQLSIPATDSGVIEVSRTEELMVAYLAAALLLEGDATTRSESVANDLRTSAGELRAKVGELARGIGQNRQQATLPRSM